LQFHNFIQFQAALETETPTNFIPSISVHISPNAGLTDPTIQLIADEAQHIQLTGTHEEEEGFGGGVWWCYQLMNKNIAEKIFKFALKIENDQLHYFHIYN